MDTVDVWLISLGSEDAEPVLVAFARAFELPIDRAREMTARLPRVVLRAAEPEEASRLAERLEAVGAVVEVRPSAPAMELSPGSRPSRPSQPVAAAPPVSLFPRPSSERSRSLRPSLRPRFEDMDGVPSTGRRIRRAIGLLMIVCGSVALVAAPLPALVTIGTILVGVALFVWA